MYSASPLMIYFSGAGLLLFQDVGVQLRRWRLPLGTYGPDSLHVIAHVNHFAFGFLVGAHFLHLTDG
jgi:hypothetical protein